MATFGEKLAKLGYHANSGRGRRSHHKNLLRRRQRPQRSPQARQRPEMT
jgi:hypothetical protein